ncbi:S26 family signal peptidase [Natronosalvus vescus]|uniref:S26 family signal peptidase n=1 Tax=Natronosalvus vescus TaxID=2953881 RepID=UPI0020909E96|nr:S26 family signal peptidase [Natronosalvus vescus]
MSGNGADDSGEDSSDRSGSSDRRDEGCDPDADRRDEPRSDSPPVADDASGSSNPEADDDTTVSDSRHSDTNNADSRRDLDRPSHSSSHRDDTQSPESDDEPENRTPEWARDHSGGPASPGQTATDSDTGRRYDSSPPPRKRPDDDRVTIEDDGVVRWFFKTDHGTVVAVRDILSSVALVAFIGLLLFAISGIWPPLVAVESGSMEPNMERGDMIFVVAVDRFVGDGPVDGTGVVTLDTGVENGHEKFGKPGDVIIFRPNGAAHETPVIHRAHFWVEEDENWVDEQANPEYVNGNSCDQIQACPAPHDGFITKGDANSVYDQTTWSRGADTTVVKPEWTTGKGMFRIPWLGHIRLGFERLFPSMIAIGFQPGVSVPVSSGLLPPLSLSTTLVGTAGAIGFARVSQVDRGRRRRF